MEKKCTVYSSREVEKQICRVPKQIKKNLEAWIEDVEFEGINEIRKLRGYNDEALQGQRFGQRSIRLNRSYRLIYKEHKKENIILLLEVNKHEY